MSTPESTPAAGPATNPAPAQGPKFPPLPELHKSISIYLRHAYPSGALPALVQARASKLLGADSKAAAQASFEKDGARYVLRLGQQAYPFMKLVLEPAPGDATLLFRADAHDSHLHAPPDSPDAAQLAHLRTINQTLVEAIEQEWACAGLPTFRSFLRDRIAARRRDAGPPCASED